MEMRPEQKARMLSEGKWAEFVAYRCELRARGLTRGIANREALAKFIGERPSGKKIEPKKVILKVDSGRVKEKREMGRPQKEIAIPIPEPETYSGITSGGGASAPRLRAVSVNEFGGRESSEVQIIRWVARNMDVVDVDVSQCPDPAAWSLLNQCRMSASFKSEFWKSLYSKAIPSKALLGEKEGDVEVDGAVTIEIIDSIENIKQRAEQGARGADAAKGDKT